MSEPNWDVVFNQDKSITNDRATIQYLERQEKARKEELDKKKRICPDYSKMPWNRNKNVYKQRAISTEMYPQSYTQNNSILDIKYLKRHLHDELHNLNDESQDS